MTTMGLPTSVVINNSLCCGRVEVLFLHRFTWLCLEYLAVALHLEGQFHRLVLTMWMTRAGRQPFHGVWKHTKQYCIEAIFHLHGVENVVFHEGSAASWTATREVWPTGSNFPSETRTRRFRMKVHSIMEETARVWVSVLKDHQPLCFFWQNNAWCPFCLWFRCQRWPFRKGDKIDSYWALGTQGIPCPRHSLEYTKYSQRRPWPQYPRHGPGQHH